MDPAPPNISGSDFFKGLETNSYILGQRETKGVIVVFEKGTEKGGENKWKRIFMQAKSGVQAHLTQKFTGKK